MTQEKRLREAFVAGAKFGMPFGVSEDSSLVQGFYGEALRRYPDKAPEVPKKRWRCSECLQLFASDRDARMHTIEFGHRIIRFVVESEGEGK